ncbi:hypothetical protein Tco_1502336 [Tanacetum coccineum]
MDDPNITMEEYIRLEEEKAQRHGQTFNWQTATYSKMEYCEDEDTNFKTEYLAIVFDDTDATLLCESTSSGRNAINIDTKGLEKPLKTGHSKLEKSSMNLYLPFGIPFDPKRYYKDGVHKKILRRPRAPLVRELILEFLSTCRMGDIKMGLDVADTLCFQLGGVRRRMTWRQFILALGLHSKEEMAEVGFGAYWLGRPILFYVFIRDPVRRLCQGMIAFSISGRGQYLFRHAKGRKSGARLSGGHFIGCLAAHFRLVSGQGLRGLSVVTYELSLIDLHKLGRLNICVRVDDTWAWVAPGPKRQPDAAAGALVAAEDAPVVDEGA